MADKKTYLCIDLKSFYASVECVERGLDPLTTNLVVADVSRTEKTICLAVTPSLKKYGLSGRSRLFEVVRQISKVNAERRRRAPRRELIGKSSDAMELSLNPSLEIDYIIAPPRMALYIDFSTRIYKIYLRHVSSDDILVYSIDEVFMDITGYLKGGGICAREFALKILRDVLDNTGVTATVGIGTNMYLAKVAMDITAKKMKPDKDGARIAELDEIKYRKELWSHRPIGDFWRIGRGYAKKLEERHMHTMGDIARASVTPYGRKTLKNLFGINAKLLVDHAWGYEPCTIDEVKSYIPENNSMSSGQVLKCPYSFDKAKLVVWEMTEALALDLVEKRLVTDQIVLTIGYDVENLICERIRRNYKGEVTTDYYGRKIPKHARGTENIGRRTSSAALITRAALKLFDRIADKDLLVRRIVLSANRIVDESLATDKSYGEQIDMFSNNITLAEQVKDEEMRLKKERKIQETTIKLRKRYGKNAVLKGASLQEGATALERGKQIGGHKA